MNFEIKNEIINNVRVNYEDQRIANATNVREFLLLTKIEFADRNNTKERCIEVQDYLMNELIHNMINNPNNQDYFSGILYQNKYKLAQQAHNKSKTPNYEINPKNGAKFRIGYWLTDKEWEKIRKEENVFRETFIDANQFKTSIENGTILQKLENFGVSKIDVKIPKDMWYDYWMEIDGDDDCKVQKNFLNQLEENGKFSVVRQHLADVIFKRSELLKAVSFFDMEENYNIESFEIIEGLRYSSFFEIDPLINFSVDFDKQTYELEFNTSDTIKKMENDNTIEIKAKLSPR